MIGVVGIFYYYGVGASMTSMASMGACANGILVLFWSQCALRCTCTYSMRKGKQYPYKLMQENPDLDIIASGY